MANQYAERDIMCLEKSGGHYTRHISAMTGEGLYDKSDIAAELAYRDARIAELEAQVEQYKAAEEAQIEKLRTYTRGEVCSESITHDWVKFSDVEEPLRRMQHLEQRVKIFNEELEQRLRQNLQLMRERDTHKSAEEAQIALRQKMEKERDRRDLIKGAEALERVIRVMGQPIHGGGQTQVACVEDLQAMADNYRQQAEDLP